MTTRNVLELRNTGGVWRLSVRHRAETCSRILQQHLECILTRVVAPSTLIVHQTYHRSAPTLTPLEQAQAITARPSDP